MPLDPQVRMCSVGYFAHAKPTLFSYNADSCTPLLYTYVCRVFAVRLSACCPLSSRRVGWVGLGQEWGGR
jgi:hypothetical protein